MPNLPKLSLIITALTLALAAPSFAQEKIPDMPSEASEVDIFNAADVDTDGLLDRDEFISYVVMASGKGEADYSAIKLSGEYDNHFNTKDYNADGLLTAEELKHSEMDYDEGKSILKEDATIEDPR